jgi:geranylgeranyl diphosphate synthase type I
VDQAGGREWAAGEAERRLDAALAELDSSEIPADTRDGLAALARFIVTRDY